MASILTRIGGKHYLAKKIVGEIQKYEYQCFVDVFGGAGHITFELLRTNTNTKIYVINDIEYDIYNFFTILRDRPKELYKLLSKSIYSRKLLKEANNKLYTENISDNLLRAYYYFILIRQSFPFYKGFAFSKKNRPNKGHSSNPESVRYLNQVKQIKTYHSLISNCIIDCIDYSRIIKNYDCDTTLFYCDPPYFGYEDCYINKFTLEDHIKLAELLNNCKGQVILSYYPCEIVDKYYNDWYRIESEINLASQKVSGNKREKRTELILIKPNTTAVKEYTQISNQLSLF